MIRLLLALVVVLFQGCVPVISAQQYENPPSPTSPAAEQAVPTRSMQAEAVPDMAGVWQGQSVAGCERPLHNLRCHAVNQITFTLMQKSSTVTGYYKCAYGNLDCLNMNDNGRIANGNMDTKLLTMRVMMQDGSDCIFNGLPKGDKIEGGYLCLQGGGVVERGTWGARRSY